MLKNWLGKRKNDNEISTNLFTGSATSPMEIMCRYVFGQQTRYQRKCLHVYKRITDPDEGHNRKDISFFFFLVIFAPVLIQIVSVRQFQSVLTRYVLERKQKNILNYRLKYHIIWHYEYQQSV